MRSLDLFRAKPDGTIEWCGSFFSMEAAKAKLQELLVAEPDDYFILDQVTGQKIDPNALFVALGTRSTCLVSLNV
jgi:hypothetical protein